MKMSEQPQDIIGEKLFHRWDSEQPQELEQRITAYLSGGGLFNPELADHDRVRDLLIDCRAALAAERQAVVDAMSLSNEMCRKLEKQLAADKLAWGRRIGEKDNEIRALQQQLAATYEQHHTELWRQCERLREQLAAAKADADNWFGQYKAMKCAGSTDLELELEKTEQQLAAERSKVKELEAALLAEREKVRVQSKSSSLS
jgi:hypothetical protein